jgi:hypothetical protein
MAMTRYIAMRRGDGLPDDPWLRVHIRAGGRILQVAPSLDGNGRLARPVAGLDRAAV